MKTFGKLQGRSAEVLEYRKIIPGDFGSSGKLEYQKND